MYPTQESHRLIYKSTFYDQVAYQIKGNEAYNNIVANSWSYSYPWPWGGVKVLIYDSIHVAFQIN